MKAESDRKQAIPERYYSEAKEVGHCHESSTISLDYITFSPKKINSNGAVLLFLILLFPTSRAPPTALPTSPTQLKKEITGKESALRLLKDFLALEDPSIPTKLCLYPSHVYVCTYACVCCFFFQRHISVVGPYIERTKEGEQQRILGSYVVQLVWYVM